MLRLYGLRVGERLIAVFHTMAARPRLYVYLSGFDPALPQISPGSLVLAHLIQHAAGDSVLALHAWPPDAILLAPVSNCSGASSPGSWRMRQDAGQYGACSGFERCSMTKQLLHLVFGGELTDPTSTEFADLKGLDLVGIYPNYEEAYKAWCGKAQTTIDNAHMRYFVVHLHRLLDPASEPPRLGGSE